MTCQTLKVHAGRDSDRDAGRDADDHDADHDADRFSEAKRAIATHGITNVSHVRGTEDTGDILGRTLCFRAAAQGHGEERRTATTDNTTIPKEETPILNAGHTLCKLRLAIK